MKINIVKPNWNVRREKKRTIQRNIGEFIAKIEAQQEILGNFKLGNGSKNSKNDDKSPSNLHTLPSLILDSVIEEKKSEQSAMVRQLKDLDHILRQSEQMNEDLCNQIIEVKEDSPKMRGNFTGLQRLTARSRVFNDYCGNSSTTTEGLKRADLEDLITSMTKLGFS